MFHCKFIETDDYDKAIFEFVQLAKTVGWKISQSSDGISYEIEHCFSGLNGLSNNLAWLVLQTKYGKELLFQRGKNNNNWWISYSPQYGFSKGLTAIRPTALDEGKLLHNNFGKPFTLEKKLFKWCFGVSDSCESFYFIALSETNFMYLFIGMDNINIGTDISALLFGTSFTPKSLLYFDDNKCKNITIDNWKTGSNFIFKNIQDVNGTVHDSMLLVDYLLMPWSLTYEPTKKIINYEIKEGPLKKIIISKVNYKMIGKIKHGAYHSWVVAGEPDFKGEKAGIYGLTDIYVADKWKGK